jgi:predicted RNA methylase
MRCAPEADLRLSDQGQLRREMAVQDGVTSAFEFSLPQPRRDRTFPTWHFAMLNDAKRNGTMEAAIKDAGISGKTVFEIGTGAGLTALMLARNGALHVTTCEINVQLFDIAKAVIEKSEFQDRMTVINKSSTDAIDDGDVPLAPDFIFTETIDCGVVDDHNYYFAFLFKYKLH